MVPVLVVPKNNKKLVGYPKAFSVIFSSRYLFFQARLLKIKYQTWEEVEVATHLKKWLPKNRYSKKLGTLTKKIVLNAEDQHDRILRG
jgi:hypothetical protein